MNEFLCREVSITFSAIAQAAGYDPYGYLLPAQGTADDLATAAVKLVNDAKKANNVPICLTLVLGDEAHLPAAPVWACMAIGQALNGHVKQLKCLTPNAFIVIFGLGA